MSLSEFLSAFFGQIWRIFLMPSGLFGLKFSDILFGGFVLSVGIWIIRFLFIPKGLASNPENLRDRLLNKKYDKKGD